MVGGVEMKDGHVIRFFDPRVQQLFDHACDAIELGVEDYQASFKDPRRLMSAVRNFDAGLELLCKTEIASTRFEDVCEKNADGTVRMIGGRVLTIRMSDIRKRFAKSWPCGIFELKELNEYRNDVEHLYPENPQDAWGRLGRAFVWMFNFFEKVLLRDPQRDFSPRVWAFLSSLQSIVLELQREMEDVFSELSLPDIEVAELAPCHFVCPDCRSVVVRVDSAESLTFLCGHCSRRFDYAQLVEAVYPNCYCGFCGNSLEDESEMEVFVRTGFCGHCDYVLSKDD